MPSELSRKMIEQYGKEDASKIVEEYFNYIVGIEKDQELRNALTSLFDKGYIVGFKNALIERVETDIQTLDFMSERAF